jgi:hypothetical protein
LKSLLQAGKIVPATDRHYRLSDAGEALRYLPQGHAQGNRVIERARSPTAGNGENLPAPTVERDVHQHAVRASGLSSENTENKEKPAWQIRREEEMARLDREAEVNRQRGSRLQPTKVFKPSVFVGRSED